MINFSIFLDSSLDLLKSTLIQRFCNNISIFLFHKILLTCFQFSRIIGRGRPGYCNPTANTASNLITSTALSSTGLPITNTSLTRLNPERTNQVSPKISVERNFGV